MVATGEAAPAMTARRLDRQDGRRRRGEPTLTVLSGPARASSDVLLRWAAGRGRSLVWLEPDRPEPAGIAQAWTGRLAAGRDLASEAIEWLERRLGRAAGSLGPSLRGMTPYEIGMFLDGVLPSISPAGAETACRWALRDAAERGWRRSVGGPNAVAGELDHELGAGMAVSPCVHPRLRVLVALGEIVPPERQPVLVLAHPGRRPVDEPGAWPWVEHAARMLADLAFAQPRVMTCLALEPALLGAYLDRAAESRAKAMVRGSIVTVPDAGVEERAIAAGLILAPAPGEATVSGDGLEDDDRARSAAERLLFDRLEAMPETAGLFRLNETIDLAFGHNRKMEIDLAAPALTLAVEIDGYYHFQDPEAYRRDRRKDLELQKYGYLVVRVLAEDVLAAPGGAIETILGAIAFRRGRPGTPPRDDA